MVQGDLVRYLLLGSVKSGEQLRILSRIALIMSITGQFSSSG